MAEKTYRFIHVLYILLITNIMSIIYLLLGLFSLTLVPVIGTNITIMNLLSENVIDGYTGIVRLYNDLMKENFKKFKKESLIIGIYCLILIVARIMIKNINLPITGILNYVFMYMYAMIIIYWAYYSFYNILKERVLSHINALALMFYKPQKIFLTVLTFILAVLVGVIRKEILCILCISVMSLSFVKINKDMIQDFI